MRNTHTRTVDPLRLEMNYFRGGIKVCIASPLPLAIVPSHLRTCGFLRLKIRNDDRRSLFRVGNGGGTRNDGSSEL